MNADITLKQIDGNGHVYMELTVPATALAPLLDNSIDYLANECRLKPGATYETLCDSLGTDQAPRRLAELLMEECASAASGNLILPIACNPKLALVEDYIPGHDLSFSFETYLLPRGTLDSFDPVRIDESYIEADNDRVERKIAQMLRRSSPLTELDEEHGISMGDVIKANIYVERYGVPVAGLCRTGVLIEVEDGDMPQEFLHEILGMRKNQDKGFSFYASQSPNAGGHADRFDARVSALEVYERVVPELTDAWVQQNFPGIQSVESLRNAVAQGMGGTAAHGTSAETAIEQKLLERLQVEISDEIAEFATCQRMSLDLQELAKKNLTLEEYLAGRNVDEKEYSSLIRNDELWKMKRAAALDALFDGLKLALDEEDVDEIVASFGMGDLQEAKRQFVLDGKMHIIVEQAQREKAHRWLMDTAVVE